jgi:hypothetical protein
MGGEAKAEEAEQTKALASLASVLADKAGGVKWTHCRLQFRGPGSVGKSSTIDAMSGKEFDAKKLSTVGAAIQVRTTDLVGGGTDAALAEYTPPTAGEYASAAAAQAAASESGGKGMLALEKEAQERRAAAEREAKAAAARPKAGGGSSTQGGTQQQQQQQGQQRQKRQQQPQPTPTAPKATAPPSAPVDPTPGEPTAAAAGGTAAAPRPPMPVGEEERRRYEDAKLVIQAGEAQQKLVMHIQDCGGQEVFLSILDLLHAPKATISVLVFSMPKLQNPALRASALAQLRTQLDSFRVHASSSPLLLVGTRKDEAVKAGGGDEAHVLRELSKGLRSDLTNARLKNLVENGELCFFPVENSRGYRGDETIRQLVAAINAAAMKLESMNQRVPLGWLAVYDELRKQETQWLSLANLTAIAMQQGLPHMPESMSIEREVEVMLRFLHSIGAVCWFDVPEQPALRDLVILEPQWIVDAVCMVIRNYRQKEHGKPCDEAISREHETEWDALTSLGKLDSVVLEYLWGEDRFKHHKRELLALMEHFGLVVPVRGKVGSFTVPSLLALGGATNPPSAPDGAPQITLHFRLSETPPPKAAPVWSEDDLASGFLPDGAFHELCGSAVGWSYHTAKLFTPLLGRGFAHVRLGRHEALLERPASAPYVVATFIKGTADEPYALAAAVERLVLLVDGIGKRFANLRCTPLLRLTDDRLVEREALLPAASGSEALLDELRYEGLANVGIDACLPSPTPPDHYGGFLSYSHVAEFDTPFAERLADCLGAQSPMVTPFLDTRMSNLHGDLDAVCLLAMANSRVVVPIVTWNALRRMTILTPSSPINDGYLLLEWTFALLQHEHGAHIMPVFVGCTDADGRADPTRDLFAARPPKASADGRGNALDEASGGRPIPDGRDVFSRVPNVVVASVADSLERFYDKHNLVPPTEIRTLTAWEVVARISRIRGEATASAHHAVTHQLQLADDWGLHEAVADPLAKAVAKAPLPKLLGEAVPAKTAFEGKTEASFEQRALEMLGSLQAGQKRASDARKANHAEIMRGQGEIMQSVERLHSSVAANSSMLRTLLVGEHDCPRWLVALPKPAETKRLKKVAGWFNPKHWLGKKMLLFFVCPVTMDTVGSGIELTMPADWVKRYGPAIRVGLSMLRLGIGVAKLSGVPLPDIGELGIQAVNEVERRAAYLGEICDGLREQLEGASLGGVVSWAERQLDGVKSAAGAPPEQETGEAIRHSYQQVVSLLGSLEKGKTVRDIVDRCGLVKAICDGDGSVEWVAERWRAAYERHGSRLLGLDEAGRERLRAGGVAFDLPAAPSGGGGGGSSSSAPPGSLSRQKTAGTLARLLGRETGASSSKLREMGSTKLRKMYDTIFGSSSSLVQVEADTSEEVAGLRAVLKAAKLEKEYAKAVAWCDENGVDSIAFLKDAGMEDDLVEHLSPKKAQAKVLTKKLAEYVPPPVAAEDVTLQPERSAAPLKRQYTQEQLEQRQAAAERRKVASEKFKAEKGAVARAE